MALHSVVKCHIRFGMQAAIERSVWVTTVLIDGLILRPVNQRHLEHWWLAYDILFNFKGRRWSQEEWKQRGYRLIRDPRPCFMRQPRQVTYRSNQVIPVPLDWRWHG